MPKKGKHVTPDELDFIFDRDLISEDDYGQFWKDWFDASKREREDIIEDYRGRGKEGEEEETENLPLKGTVTKNRGVAESQAKAIHGHVVRRDRTGKFNRRGSYFQAVKNAKRNPFKSVQRSGKKK